MGRVSKPIEYICPYCGKDTYRSKDKIIAAIQSGKYGMEIRAHYECFENSIKKRGSNNA